MRKLRTAVVTGGLGFIGQHLVRELLADGRDRVVILDDHSSGSPLDQDLAADTNVHVIEWDAATDYPMIDLALGGFSVQEVFHLACPASPPFYQRDPVRTLLTSVVGANAVLRYGALTGCRVLLASTSEVYGDPLEHPQTEGYRGNVSTLGPRACYDEGKRAAETLFMDWHRSRGVDTRIARIFNTYGPGMRPDDGRVITAFTDAAFHGRPLPVFGGGGQTRSFCYVTDTVNGLVQLMGSRYTDPVNIGNPEEVTVYDTGLAIARLVAAETGRPAVGLREEPLPVDDPHRRRPDITVAGRELFWRPTVRFEDGLRETVRHLVAVMGVAGK